MNGDFAKVHAVIQELQDRLAALEETVDEQDEMIRGLMVDTEQNSEAVNNFQVELDRLDDDVARLEENDY